MINYFRKIRKKLADDNKPLRYARYAVGEIVLVVIGILIALQINNWNEENTIQAHINSQLSALIVDLKSDKEAYNQIRRFHAFRVHSVMYLIKQYGHAEDPILFPEAGELPPLDQEGLFSGPVPKNYDQQIVIKSFSWLLRYIRMTPVSNSMEEFKNTGLLARYENSYLKSGILGYYGSNNFAFDGDNRDTNPTEMLKKIFTANGFAYADAAVLEHPIETLLSVPEIRATLINIIDESIFRANMSANLDQYLEKLIKDLEKEIHQQRTALFESV